MRNGLVTQALLFLIAAAPGALPSHAADDPPELGWSDSTWVDHDGRPIPQPPEGEPSFWGHQFREGLIEPLSHLFDVPDLLLSAAEAFGADPGREAVNVNAFDEVPNSTWFTNRNHVRAVPVGEIGAVGGALRPVKPWIIKKPKLGGHTVGFQIEDADGQKWLVKLDPAGYPQLAAGADLITRTLLHAAGYNLPHNPAVSFRRGDLQIDEDLRLGKKAAPFTETDLDSLLQLGALLLDGSYSGYASLFLSGHVLGAPSTRRLRPGDTNDWYTHMNRRELRGLYVLCSWLNSWDTKDHQFLDMFVETQDSLGHVDHYILDVGASLGVGAGGPKVPWKGFEHTIDFEWTALRLLSLGFVVEPWRRAHQETGIPSVGNFESAVYEPAGFRTLIQHPAFREMSDRDGYWGAKIVASFSDAQIAAAVDAVHYEGPRAAPYLVRCLIERRDKAARYWFDRVAPLDFFSVRDSVLYFHDLAVDVGLAPSRDYDVEINSPQDGASTVRLTRTALPLLDLGNLASPLSLGVSIVGNPARATRVELTRRNSTWIITRIGHG